MLKIQRFSPIDRDLSIFEILMNDIILVEVYADESQEIVVTFNSTGMERGVACNELIDLLIIAQDRAKLEISNL